MFRREGAGLLLLALALSLAVFAPYVLTRVPQDLFYGDNAILCFPQFVDGYFLARRHVLTGIDFLTNNGGSAYFLRPNLPIYQPIYHLIYLFGRFDTIKGLAHAYVFVWYVHGVIAVYFAAWAGRRHFGLGPWPSVLLGVLYLGGIARFAAAMPVFYYSAAFFPWLLYTAIGSGRAPVAPWQVLLRSVPYVAMFLSGYLPVGVNAVALALGFALYLAWTRPGEVRFWIQARRMVAPFLLGSLVVLPLYIALLRYNQLVPGLPGGAWQAAHHLSYGAGEILGLISSGFHAGPSPVAGRPAGEWPHLSLGLLPVLLLAMAFAYRRRLQLTPFQADMAAAAAIIFCFYLALGFGGNAGLPDLFYYLVPALGKMHVYGRYAIVGSFFFCLLVAILIEPLVLARDQVPLGRWVFGLLALAIGLQVAFTYASLKPDPHIAPDILTMEFGLCALALLGFATRRAGHAFAAVIAVAVCIVIPNAHFPASMVSVSSPPPYRQTLSNQPVKEAALHAWMRANSRKTLIKILDASPGIEKVQGMGTNYPWMAQNRIMLSNYMGYEQGTSVDRDYAKTFPYWGTVSFPWALRTGADFIVYLVGMPNYAAELKDWVDPQVPQFELGNGYRVAKLRDAAGLLPSVPARRPGEFDNGIVRVFSSAGTSTVRDYSTDFASRVEFEVESSATATVLLQLFPNKLMQLRVDGKALAAGSPDTPVSADLPAGRHRVEYAYHNPIHSLFALLVPPYILLLAAVLCWRGWRTLRTSFYRVQAAPKPERVRAPRRPSGEHL